MFTRLRGVSALNRNVKMGHRYIKYGWGNLKWVSRIFKMTFYYYLFVWDVYSCEIHYAILEMSCIGKVASDWLKYWTKEKCLFIKLRILIYNRDSMRWMLKIFSLRYNIFICLLMSVLSLLYYKTGHKESVYD